jgi:xanthine dehydrogenase accessory factor
MALERQIIEAAARLRRQREPHLIATVVRVDGSVYRRPGARMLLTRFRWFTGALSGGYLAGDIAKNGWSRTADGEPVVVTYDARLPHDSDDDDIRSAFGMGEDGVVDLMIERAGTAGRLDPLAFAWDCIRTQRRGAIVTVIRSHVPEVKIGMRVAVRAGQQAQADAITDEVMQAAMIADARAAIANGESINRSYMSQQGCVDVFVEAILPPPRVFVFGTGHDAVPVVQLARAIGWEVTVCADQVRASTRERFGSADDIVVGSPADLATRIDESDRAIAIVMNHNDELDRDHLGMLIGTRAHYIGMLGTRRRTTRMLNELQLVAHGDRRLHVPMGLELGAQTPHEVALAVVAEVQAVLAGLPAEQPDDRTEPARDRPLPRIADELETTESAAS